MRVTALRWMLRLILPLTLLAWSGAACDSSPPMPPQAAAGQKVFERLGCVACHSFDKRVLPGPPLRGIYGQEVHLLDGTSLVRDDAYLERSILDPAAQVVDGYRPTMVSYGPLLQEGELAQLLALIRYHSGSQE